MTSENVARADLERIGVVGGGQMGSGIAEVCARAGREVIVVESSDAAVRAARERIARSLDRSARSGRLTEADREEVDGRLRVTAALADLADSDLVVEAIAEDEKLKTAVFTELDRIVTSPDALLASNTSSIPIMKLGMATGRPDRVVGIHFFNPVPVLKLVEIVPSLLTTAETEDRARTFVTEALGKHAIRCQDRAGFVVNALLVPFLLSAIRMMESGFASQEDIDTGMVQGCAHPMGPLRLADLIGLDTVGAIAESMYEEFRDPVYSPPPLLARMVEAGMLGRKSGRGFYPYS